VRTEAVTAEDGKVTRYFVADGEEALLHLVNLGAIPLHLWASRIGSLQHPDWCILDLDAKDAPFAAAVEVARAAQRLCRELGLSPHLKTSGASGLHVLLPLGARVTHEQSRQLAELLARLLAGELPQLASVARLPQARPGKVYVDYLQNGYGKLLVAPYSVRPRPGAPVSTPLDWDELTPDLDPGRYTLRTLPARLAQRRDDPLEPVLTASSDLPRALARIARRMGGGRRGSGR
jgi:bifunctional non-homologous end joining protein LigD